MPTVSELYDIFKFWHYSTIDSRCVYYQEENFGYKRKEVKTVFEEAIKT
jgi:hypothetical protein